MERNKILNELLQDADQLRPSQVEFIKSVQKYYKRFKRISDSQFFVLREIRAELNEKALAQVTGLIIEKIPGVIRINKKPADGGGQY